CWKRQPRNERRKLRRHSWSRTREATRRGTTRWDALLVVGHRDDVVFDDIAAAHGLFEGGRRCHSDYGHAQISVTAAARSDGPSASYGEQCPNQPLTNHVLSEDVRFWPLDGVIGPAFVVNS